ncbi:MAG: GTP cyclohydrolase II [Paracoccaceae bacterium]
MPLGPNPAERLSRARADLRMGLPVVLGHGTHFSLMLAAEGVEPARLQKLRDMGKPVLALTTRRAETLKIPAYDGDLVRIEVSPDVDAHWIAAMADPSHDLDHPMKGPCRARREGDALFARAALSLTRSAQLLPAALLVEVDAGKTLALSEDLTFVDLGLVEGVGTNDFLPIASARVPLVASPAGRVHVFRPENGGEEHFVIEIGSPPRDRPVLARLHSACFTGDVLGSLKCDCGAQLNAALDQMGKEGAGVLLYLNQEGRGIGLANKMRAYGLQDQGFDTVEANHRLGFEDDERDFRIGAALLTRLGFGAVNLMTNNPAKVRMMEAAGIRVNERVPLQVGKTRQNAAYLATKAAKSGHLM